MNHSGPIPIPNSIGNFTYVRSAAEFTKSLGTGSTTDFLIVLWTPSSCRMFEFSSGGVCTEHKQSLIDNEKPAFIRPGRCGVKIMNVSKALDVGGYVSVYHNSNPLNLNLTTGTGATDTATIDALNTLLSDKPSVRKYSAAELTKGKHWWLMPASAQQFPEWQVYQDINLGTVTEQLVINQGLIHQGTTTLVIGFHKTSTNQTYEVRCESEDFCRFMGNTIAAAAQQAPPDSIMTDGFDAAASFRQDNRVVPYG